MNTAKILMMLACLLVVSAAPASTVYKWIDEKGVVNYTTTPPPQDGRSGKPAVLEVAPAVGARGAAADTGEAHYWRARAEREAARDLAEARMRRETEELRQARLRQQLAAAERDATKKTAAQAAVEQCRAERRIDCENAPGMASGGVIAAAPAYPQVVVVTRAARAPVAQPPYFSSPPNFTPGFSGMMMPSR